MPYNFLMQALDARWATRGADIFFEGGLSGAVCVCMCFNSSLSRLHLYAPSELKQVGTAPRPLNACRGETVCYSSMASKALRVATRSRSATAVRGCCG